MRQTDRVYFLNTIAVLQNQKHSIVRVLQDMDLRLEELEESLVLMFDQDEENRIDRMLDDARDEGFTMGLTIDFEEDMLVYDTLRNKQPECMCDDCWNDLTADKYDHRMD